MADTVAVFVVTALFVAVLFGLEFSVELYAGLVGRYFGALTDLIIGL